MAINSRQKGKAGEQLVKSFLEKHSEHSFSFTPGSGSGIIKGDLHIEGKKNTFCIEVKSYAESPLTDKVFTSNTNNLVQWWIKLQKQSKNKSPLLFFKYNRSKLFVGTDIKPTNVNKYLDIRWLNCYIMLAEEWITQEKIEWVAS